MFLQDKSLLPIIPLSHFSNTGKKPHKVHSKLLSHYSNLYFSNNYYHKIRVNI